MRLSKAIVSIALNDFRIDEISTKRHIYVKDTYVFVTSVPNWGLFEHHLFSESWMHIRYRLSILLDEGYRPTGASRTYPTVDQCYTSP